MPSHLKYACLGEGETFPVIISSSLTSNQEKKLVNELGRLKKDIGWIINDIVGISPTFCMHKIILEDNVKPVRDCQRRPNPNMQEIVKKELLKILDARVIYPIANSK